MSAFRRELANIVVVKTQPEADATRDRVLRFLLEAGPATAGELADRLGLTPAAVRRHLDSLLAAGTVQEAPERRVWGSSRGRGRPAKRFTVTEAGRSAFPHAYDDLAAAALRFLVERGGPPAVEEFAKARVAGAEDRYRTALTPAASPAERAAALAEVLTADGYAASTAVTGAGMQLCQHHCPVAHVAAAFPQLCDAELDVFSRLLGTHLQRLATLAHGDGVCTTHVPVTAPAPTPTGRTSP